MVFKRLFFVPLIGLISCQSKQNKKTTIDKCMLYTEVDTVIVNKIKFSKEEFNKIVDNFPRLYQDKVIHPDSLYKSEFTNSNFDETFGQLIPSDEGKDRFFALYGYFLAKKNERTRFSYLRNDLTVTYQSIIAIFERMNRGSTLFTHQHNRISAYVEYDIYFINNSQRIPEFTKKTRAERFEFITELKEKIVKETQKADLAYDFKNEKIEDVLEKLNNSIVNDYVLYRAKKILQPHLSEFKENQQ